MRYLAIVKQHAIHIEIRVLLSICNRFAWSSIIGYPLQDTAVVLKVVTKRQLPNSNDHATDWANVKSHVCN